MSRTRPPKHPAHVLTLVLLAGLASACSGSASPGEGPSSKSDRGEATDAQRANGAERDRLLGPVNLPVPDWLPAGFPLPEDARIYLVSTSNTTPVAYQLQARTLAEREEITDSLGEWSYQANVGLTDSLAGRAVGNTSVMEVTGAGFGVGSSVQVMDEGGKYRRIILSIQTAP